MLCSRPHASELVEQAAIHRSAAVGKTERLRPHSIVSAVYRTHMMYRTLKQYKISSFNRLHLSYSSNPWKPHKVQAAS